MIAAVFPGSFDPITWGHLDVVQAAAPLFDAIHWLVMTNMDKQSMFSLDERMAMLANVVVERGLKYKVQLTPYLEPGSRPETLVAWARKLNAPWLIRSLRLTSDYEYELQLAMINRHLGSDVQTLFLAPRQEHLHISSSTVRTLIKLGVPIDDYVPPEALRGLDLTKYRIT